MNRFQLLRANKSRDALGLEIGPSWSPIFPKKEGWNIRSIDVFDQQALIERASQDPSIGERIANIEPVDYIYKGSLLEAVKAGLSADEQARVEAGQGLFDYICSSHNFEHQANPIKFLIDCFCLLMPGGSLTMAIPTASRCFDRCRPLTTTGQLIDAYLDQAVKPSVGQIIDHHLFFAVDSESNLPVLSRVHPASRMVMPQASSGSCWNASFLLSTLSTHESAEFPDVHCWLFNRFSFELILLDLQRLGVLPSIRISSSMEREFEFIVNVVIDESATEPASDRCGMAVAACHAQASDLIRLQPLTLDWS